MPNLYKIVTKSEDTLQRIDLGETMSIFYHNIFDFPLTISDLIKWKMATPFLDNTNYAIKQKNGFFFLEGSEGIIYKRTLRNRISERKMKVAKKAGRILSLIPFVKMVAVTGSLAMQNANPTSDIDLMIVTSKNSLWVTRLLSYLILRLANISVRKFGEKDETDKLCLNIWLDENDLFWKNRNVYTAHEIAQIIPLVNKSKTYEKFLLENKWILNFWPNSVKIRNHELRIKQGRNVASYVILNALFLSIEKFAFWIQKKYMRSKITSELITPTRALFHPQDWSKVVLDRLGIDL